MSPTTSKRRPRKKAKLKKGDDDGTAAAPRFWTSLEEIPPMEESGMAREIYREKLGESLLHAVTEGNNLEFVRNVLQTKRTRQYLAIRQHEPQTSGPNAEIAKVYNIAEPVQPFFGLQTISWNKDGNWRHFERKNLIVEAIHHNRLEMVQELILNLGFDLNATTPGGGTYNRQEAYYPLVAAIEKGHRPIISFLLEQPNIIITHPAVLGRSPRRCSETALSVAVNNGMVDVVQQLIEKGALEPASTSRPDDPYSLVKCSRFDINAKELVSMSVNKAIMEAHKAADPRMYGVKRNKEPVILELLLSKTGMQKGNAITALILDNIKNNHWGEFSNNRGYLYTFDKDLDFGPRGAKPIASFRAMAIVRGLRPSLSERYWADDGGVRSEMEQTRIQERLEQWSNLVTLCRERLATNPLSSMEGYRQRQMLLWCRLFASPWSKSRHLHYPSSTRMYIRDVLRVGSILDRNHGQAGAFKEMWDGNILPFVIE